MLKSRIATFCLTMSLAAALAACKKHGSETTAATPARQSTPAAAASATTAPITNASPALPFDACSLVTNDEVAAVQGAPVSDAKNTGRSGGGIAMWQCFYTATEYSKSVTVSVTRRDTPGTQGRGPRDVWRETFGRFADEPKDEGEKAHEAEREREKEHEGRGPHEREEEEKRPPTKVEGVGEQAFWISGVGGTLYVLKGDAFVRVSVGGPAKDDGKLEKAKAIAAKAVERL